MPYSSILGQDVAIGFLQKTAQTRRFANAYLFLGPPHVGKAKTAVAFAQHLNCQQPSVEACGRCNHCRQIQEETFTNYRMVVPDGNFVRISQIHELQEWMSYRVGAKEYRVVVVDQAGSMNRESANAFLKTLEEPPQQTLIILIAETTEQLLETIVSRCQTVRFNYLNQPTIEHILKQQPNLSDEQATFLSSFSQGSLPLEWLEQVDRLRELCGELVSYLVRPSGDRMVEILQKCLEWTAAKSQDWKHVLDFMDYWYRDLACILHAQATEGFPQEQLYFRDHLPALQQNAGRLKVQHAIDMHRAVLETRHRISLNANKTLALEALWLKVRKAMA